MRVFDPIQGEVFLPCNDIISARALAAKIRFAICHLPVAGDSVGAAVCAAMGRLASVKSFYEKQGGAASNTEKNGCCKRLPCFSTTTWKPNHNVRNQRDRETCQQLEKVCEHLLLHAEEQERLLEEILEWQEEKAKEQARLADEERKQREAEERRNQSCCRRICCGLICGTIVAGLLYIWAWIIWFRDFMVDMLGLADLWEWICCCLEREEEDEEEEDELKHDYTEEQVAAFHEVFKSADLDGSGMIDATELAATMRAMGGTPSKQDIDALMERFDVDHNGTLDFEETLLMLSAPHTDQDGELLNLFRYEAESFAEQIRNELLPAYQLAREQEEDEAREHVPGCLCKKSFDMFVSGNRAELTDAHRGGRVWLIYTMMSLYMVIVTFYIILFGFCHGQATTIDWLWGLLQQDLLSCFFVRPMQIAVFNGILPGVIIEIGLLCKYRKRMRVLETSRDRRQKELHTAQQGYKEQGIELVGLNKMLNNPMHGLDVAPKSKSKSKFYKCEKNLSWFASE